MRQVGSPMLAIGLRINSYEYRCERGIGKSKVRYKSMRGYKSAEGMINGITLTQWLYNGVDEHDLAGEMAM
jgi:hypothetical protein